MVTNRLARLLLAPLTTLVMLAGPGTADVTITGNIDGNTVNYGVQGLDAQTQYVVTIEHLGQNGQSSMQSKTSDDAGRITGSGTPGKSAIEPGDTVRVKVWKDGEGIASKDFTKPYPPQPPAPTQRTKKKRWYHHPLWPWNW